MASRIRALSTDLDYIEQNLRLAHRRDDSPRSSRAVPAVKRAKEVPIKDDKEMTFEQVRQEREEAYAEMNELFERFNEASAEYTELTNQLEHLTAKKLKKEKMLDRLEAESTMCYEYEVFHKSGRNVDMSESTNHDFAVDADVVELIREMEALNIEASVPKNKGSQNSLVEQVREERDRAKRMIDMWVEKIADVRMEAAMVSTSIEHERKAYNTLKVAIQQERDMQRMNATLCAKCHRQGNPACSEGMNEGATQVVTPPPTRRGLLGRMLSSGSD